MADSSAMSVRVPYPVLALCLAMACKAESPPTAAPETPDQPTDAVAEPAEPEVPEPSDEPECAAGGRVWDGRPQDCPYEHGRCCYDTPEAACAAAECPATACQILESYPAQIACREGDPEAPTAMEP